MKKSTLEAYLSNKKSPTKMFECALPDFKVQLLYNETKKKTWEMKQKMEALKLIPYDQ